MYHAYAINDDEYLSSRGLLAPKSRVDDIDGRLRRLEDNYKRLFEASVSERVMIIVDYQYLSRSLLEHGFEIDLEAIVELICRFGAVKRRAEKLEEFPSSVSRSLVYIFDFFNRDFSDLYAIWKRRGFNFIEVSNLDEDRGSRENPTDRVIIEHSRAELESLNDRVDTVCIVSGDHGFYEIIAHARSLGKKSMVASFPRSTSDWFMYAPDMHVNLEYFLRQKSQEKPSGTEIFFAQA